MDTFASLWDEASRDIEAENEDRRVAHAKVACASFWPFLAAAQSPPEFIHRKALAADRIESVAESVGMPADRVEALLDEQFNLLHSARTAASYVEDKKSGKDVGGPYADDDDAQNAIKSDQFGEDESDLSVGGGDDDGDSGSDDDSDSDSDDSDDSDSSGDSDDDDDSGSDDDGDDDSDSDDDSDDKDSDSDSGNPFAKKDGDSDEDSKKESRRKVALPVGPDNDASSPGTITEWGQDVQMNSGAPPLVPSPTNAYDEQATESTPLTADTDVKSASRIKTALVEGEDPLLPVIEVIDSAPGQPEKPVEHDEQADFSNGYSELESHGSLSPYVAMLQGGGARPKAGERKTAAPLPAPMNGGTAGAAPQPNPQAGGAPGAMPAMVMPIGQPGGGQQKPPEGGGTSPNANMPGNQAPAESKGVAPLTGLPQDNQQSSKPRQMPSGGGADPGSMATDPFGSPSGQAGQDAAGGQQGGGTNMMSGDSGMPSAYSRKVARIAADIRRANPTMPESRVNLIARRVAKMPGVVAAGPDDVDEKANEPDVTTPPPPPAPKQQGGGGGGGGMPGMPKMPGMGGGAAGEAAAGGEAAGGAAGLAELLPLLAL